MSDVDIYSFSQHYKHLANSPELRKGERTRLRIIQRTAELLEARSVQSLTHLDICQAADLNVATFYRYFENKTDLLGQVLLLFFDFLGEISDARLLSLKDEARSDPSAYGVIFLANLQHLRVAKANRGMFRCLFEAGPDFEAVTQLWINYSNEFAMRSAARIAKEKKSVSVDELHFRALLLGGMIDDLTRMWVIRRAEPLTNLMQQQFSDDIDLALYLSDVWYQIMTNANQDKRRRQWEDLVRATERQE